MLGGGFSVYSYWQKVSSIPHDYSQYSGSSFDILGSTSDFQLRHLPYQVFRDRFMDTNNGWYQRRRHVPYSFSSLINSKYLSLFSYLWFLLIDSLERENSTGSIFFLLIIVTSGFLDEIRWSICISRSQRILSALFSRTVSGLCIYYLLVWSNFSFLHSSLWINFSPCHVSSCISFVLVCCICLSLLILLFYLLLWEFYISAFADGFSLEFEWEQVFSSVPDSSQYSGQY